jgi:hypothetical protein
MFRSSTIAFLTAAGLFSLSGAVASGERFFACSVLDEANVGSDGRLEHTLWEKKILPQNRVLLFEEASGILKYSDRFNNPVKMLIVQEGTDQNGLIALYGKEGIARNPVIILRIATWKATQPFILMDDLGVVTGTCDFK